MRKLIFLFLLASVHLFSVADESATDVLPDHSIEAEASYLGGDAKSEQISQKMVESVARDPAWMQSYLAQLNLKPGELLPYHPKLGITKSEYDYFASRIGKLNLVPLGRVKVDVAKYQGNSKITIAGDKLRLSFVLDPAKEKITTNHGELITRKEINAGGSTPLGAWQGEQWSRSDQKNGFSEKIAIGKSADGSTGIIYYDIRSPKEGVTSHFIIRYPISVQTSNPLQVPRP